MDLDLLLLPCVQLHEEGMAKSHLRRQWGRYLGTQTMHIEGANERGMTIRCLFSFSHDFPRQQCFLSTCSTSVWCLGLYQMYEIAFSVHTRKYSAHVGSLDSQVFLSHIATKKTGCTGEVTTVMRNIGSLTPLCCNSHRNLTT